MSFDVAPGGELPPTEVYEAMTVAAEAFETLAESGRSLHFRLDDPTARVIVEVHDSDGEVLFTVPPSRALDVAAGGGLE